MLTTTLIKINIPKHIFSIQQMEENDFFWFKQGMEENDITQPDIFHSNI